ncbi:MAG TPA: class I SAM-dependent methyltransferase [Polyangiaceae bacterium]|jgi:predicted O-methyltransferase YrrM|nr:class I SAM-dependent methyltransferase [Polyangiaceae bacterium]
MNTDDKAGRAASSTLASPPVATLLARLFDEAEASNARVRELFGAIPPEERARRMSDPNADYRGFYGRAKELYLAVSPATARLLYMLARATGARSIVEFGTSFGISTLHMAAALRDNGGGLLIGTELEANKVTQARANLTAAGLADLVDVREGDALETLSRDLPETIDLVLLDGHKPLYPKILDQLAPRLRSGACIVADNADASPTYVARVREAGGPFVSVPFAHDVELSLKV